MIAKAAGALAVVALVAVLALLARYEMARDAWRLHGAAIGTAGYDASASDAAYREVEGALTWLTRAVRVGAVVTVAAGIAVARTRPRVHRADGARSRRVAARLIDLLSVAIALGLSRVGAASPGIALCVDWIAPALVLALALGATVNGATLGDRALGLARPALTPR